MNEDDEEREIEVSVIGHERPVKIKIGASPWVEGLAQFQALGVDGAEDLVRRGIIKPVEEKRPKRLEMIDNDVPSLWEQAARDAGENLREEIGGKGAEEIRKMFSTERLYLGNQDSIQGFEVYSSEQRGSSLRALLTRKGLICGDWRIDPGPAALEPPPKLYLDQLQDHGSHRRLCEEGVTDGGAVGRVTERQLKRRAELRELVNVASDQAEGLLGLRRCLVILNWAGHILQRASGAFATNPEAISWDFITYPPASGTEIPPLTLWDGPFDPDEVAFAGPPWFSSSQTQSPPTVNSMVHLIGSEDETEDLLDPARHRFGVHLEPFIGRLQLARDLYVKWVFRLYAEGLIEIEGGLDAGSSPKIRPTTAGWAYYERLIQVFGSPWGDWFLRAPGVDKNNRHHETWRIQGCAEGWGLQ